VIPHLDPAQEFGGRWLAGRRRAILGDGMRVGKTPQSIYAADLVGARNVLVVCPAIARDHWAREFDRWSLLGRPVAVVEEASDPIEPSGVTIVSMDGARTAGLFARVMRHRWDLLIVDEPQYLKDPASKRTAMVCSAEGFASRAARIWFLTGTPLLNHPAELWVMLVTVGAFSGTYRDFLDRYCEWFMGDHGPVVKGARNVPELREMLASVMLRRTFYELHPDRPRPTWQTHELDRSLVDPADWQAFLDLENNPPTPAARKLVRALMAGDDIDPAVLARDEGVTRLRWATSFAKVRPIAAWARARLEETDKLVIFAHHTRIIELLRAELAPLGSLALHGSLRRRARQAAIDAFQRDARDRVIIVQDQMGRTAVDLSAACELAFAELDWVPDNNAQAAMRVQGWNQTRPVALHDLVFPNSVDGILARVVQRKSRMIAEIL